MAPKEKAEELVGKFIHPVRWKMGQEDVKERAKQCALIAVDEIIDAVDWHEFEVPNDILHYYFEVKREIEKL